jgi:deazaflavin-dependent oxidoreductase (nitroreductase family)
MATQQTRSDFGLKMMNRIHKAILRLTGGRVLSSAFGMPAVELHTIGSKSGLPRSTMLTSPVHDEQRVVLVASKGGDDRNPQWYGNLTAHPDVELTIRGTTRKMRARTASTDEKEALWPQIVSAYKGYAGYQQKTDRNIPVVICEPRPD